MQVHIERGGQRFGPYGLDEINAHLASGMLQPTDSAWAEGMPGWVPVTQIPGVNAPGAAAPPPPSAPGEAPPPTPPSTPVSATAGNSAGKKKLLIGVGATVGVCALGAALWFFVFMKDDADSGDGKKAGGDGSGAKQTKTLAEFIKDKRIYHRKRETKIGTMYNFWQYNADGTFQEGLEDGKGNTVLPPNPPGLVMRYEVEGLTIKLKMSGGGENMEGHLTCPKAEISEGDKLVGKGPEGSVEMTVIKITSGPFKPSINVASKGRPSSSGKSPKDISNSFKAFLKNVDKNKDGKIGKDEVAHIPQWRNLFGQVDRNKDGTISSGEYITHIVTMRNGGGAKGSPKGGKSRPGVRPQGRPQPR